MGSEHSQSDIPISNDEKTFPNEGKIIELFYLLKTNAVYFSTLIKNISKMHREKLMEIITKEIYQDTETDEILMFKILENVVLEEIPFKKPSEIHGNTLITSSIMNGFFQSINFQQYKKKVIKDVIIAKFIEIDLDLNLNPFFELEKQIQNGDIESPKEKVIDYDKCMKITQIKSKIESNKKTLCQQSDVFLSLLDEHVNEIPYNIRNILRIINEILQNQGLTKDKIIDIISMFFFIRYLQPMVSSQETYSEILDLSLQENKSKIAKINYIFELLARTPLIYGKFLPNDKVREILNDYIKSKSNDTRDFLTKVISIQEQKQEIKKDIDISFSIKVESIFFIQEILLKELNLFKENDQLVILLKSVKLLNNFVSTEKIQIPIQIK